MAEEAACYNPVPAGRIAPIGSGERWCVGFLEDWSFRP